jgi:hypothetical protein
MAPIDSTRDSTRKGELSLFILNIALIFSCHPVSMGVSSRYWHLYRSLPWYSPSSINFLIGSWGILWWVVAISILKLVQGLKIFLATLAPVGNSSSSLISNRDRSQCFTGHFSYYQPSYLPVMTLLLVVVMCRVRALNINPTQIPSAQDDLPRSFQQGAANSQGSG